MTTTTLRIDSQFNGFADAAQGGIASGTFAGLVGGTASVRLLNRVPLDVDLDVRWAPRGAATVEHDGLPIAAVERAEPFRHEVPLMPTVAEALEAPRRHPLRDIRHPLSGCVVCSPHRSDGLGVVFAPSLRDRDVLVAPLHAKEQFVDGSVVRPEMLWGALDCTSFPAKLLRSYTFALTGQLTVHIEREVDADERLAVVGWQNGSGHRSHQTASAIVDETGRVVASANATWVEVPAQVTVTASAV